MEAEEKPVTIKQVGVETLLRLAPEVYYQPTVIRFNPDVGVVKTTEASFKKALGLCPKGSKSTQSFRDGVCLFRELASVGHLPSILALGDICQSRENFFGALKWYVFGFQVNWLLCGEHSAPALACLQTLNKPPLLKKYKDLKLFFRNYELFQEKHPVGKHGDPVCLISLQDVYEKKFEMHLAQEERIAKAAWFGNFYFEHYATPEELLGEGTDCFKEQKFDKALYYFNKSRLPEGLYLAGTLYLEGKVGAKDGQPDYEEAAQFYRQAQTPCSLYNLANMTQCGNIDTKNGLPDYAEAARRYALCDQNPEALCNLGNMHRNALLSLNGQPEYLEAARLYLASKHPNALFNLGRLIRDGHIRLQEGQVRVKEEAAEETPQELQDAYEMAADYFRQSGKHNEALVALANMYTNGKIGLLNGKPDIKEAIKLYKSSQAPEADLNLALLYIQGEHDLKEQKPDYAMAFLYISRLSNDVRAIRIKTYVIHYQFPAISRIVGKKSKEDLLKVMFEEITSIMNLVKGADKEYCKGVLAYERGKLDEALLHFNNALALGNSDASFYIKLAQKLIRLKEKEANRLKAETLQKLEEANDESISKKTTFPSESSPPPPVRNKVNSNNVKEAEEKPKSPPAVKPKQSKPQKLILSYEERVKRALEKINAKIMGRYTPLNATPKGDREPLLPLKITFLNETVEEDYGSLTHLKLRALLEDIEEKPYGTDGSGKPEVLLGKYKGIKGCISRRISQEHRLVYKVTGSREIQIISCIGHYE
jgi:toxin YoeB